jgi:hypothetical protein
MSITDQILRQLETRAELWPWAAPLEMPLPSGRGTVHLSRGELRGTIALTEQWVIIALDVPDAHGVERQVLPRERVVCVDFDFVDGEAEPEGQGAGE